MAIFRGVDIESATAEVDFGDAGSHEVDIDLATADVEVDDQDVLDASLELPPSFWASYEVAQLLDEWVQWAQEPHPYSPRSNPIEDLLSELDDETKEALNIMPLLEQLAIAAEGAE